MSLHLLAVSLKTERRPQAYGASKDFIFRVHNGTANLFSTLLPLEVENIITQ